MVQPGSAVLLWKECSPVGDPPGADYTNSSNTPEQPQCFDQMSAHADLFRLELHQSFLNSERTSRHPRLEYSPRRAFMEN